MAVSVALNDVKQIAEPDLSGSVFAVEGAAHPYRPLVESMLQGAALVSRDGLIIYCNPYLAGLICLALCLICSPGSTARWTVRRAAWGLACRWSRDADWLARWHRWGHQRRY